MIESVNNKYLDSKDLLNEYFVILELESIPIYFEILFDIRENARFPLILFTKLIIFVKQ